MATLKTTLYTYYFNISQPKDAEQYAALVARMKEKGVECFETWGGSSHYLGEKYNNTPIGIETEHLFGNQWNTTPIEGKSETGLRVHDWAQDYPANFSNYIKKGHYIDVTPEMKAALDNTHKCGYCGKQEPAQKGYVFCPHCIDSEYLTEDNLHLTRMQAVSNNKNRKPLSEAEKAHLLPLFIKAQTEGNSERSKAKIEKRRADLLKEKEEAIRVAETEYNGLLWLMDREIKTDNVIFYKHTGVFCFGWRGNGVDVSVKDRLLDIISEFPYSYEIKCVDGTSVSHT